MVAAQRPHRSALADLLKEAMKDFEYERRGHGERLRIEARGVVAYVRVEEAFAASDGGHANATVRIIEREDAVRMAAWLLNWATR
jgi:hypothetical protein